MSMPGQRLKSILFVAVGLFLNNSLLAESPGQTEPHVESVDGVWDEAPDYSGMDFPVVDVEFDSRF